jgi:predicted Zn-dependent protease
VASVDALVSAGRADKARALLARERGRYPGDATLCVLAARLAARAGEPATEAEELHSALLAKPDDGGIRLRLGESLMRAGREAQALGVWESLATADLSDPIRLRVQARLGECLLAAGRHPDAQRAFQVVIAANPDDCRARLGLAAACLACDKPTEALHAAQAVLAKQPEQRDALLVAALSRRRLQQTPAAVELLTRARALGDARPLLGQLIVAWQ